MAKMIKPTCNFYYKPERIPMKKNVPAVLESADEATRLINSGLAVEYEELHPQGTLNITTRGEFDVARYAAVNVNPKILVVTLYGGANYETFQYITLCSGETITLPTEEEYGQYFNVVEGTHWTGWCTQSDDPSSKVGAEITPNQDMRLYAMIAPDEEEEEIE